MSKEAQQSLIAKNRKARYDYTIEQTFEAGIQLEGWEVKSIRANKVQIVDCYVVLKNSEAFLIGCQIQPLQTASTHVETDPLRTRKLLLNRKELDRIVSAVEQRGNACVALSLQWKGHVVKATIGLAKGKKNHDKRDTEKARDAATQIEPATKMARKG